MLVLPLIPFVLTGMSHVLALLWSKFVKRKDILTIRLPFMCENSEQCRQHLLGMLAASFPFLSITYNGLCSKAFNTFSCMLLRDGRTRVMKAAPEITCWETDEHRAMVGISILAILVYVVGIPLGIFLGLRHLREQDKLRDPQILGLFGYLYMKYGPAPDSCRFC